MYKKKSFFVTFEGIEGSGKSYQSSKLHKKLIKMKLPTIFTREPGGTRGAEEIRKVILEDYFHSNVKATLNVLEASRNSSVKRFIYAASSSTYGDHPDLPKIEDKIGKPLSPYAITKYVNEIYAENFSKIYNMELIGLRYFNVFGKNQSPNGAYAAVIPKFIIRLINHQPPIINGDGSFSRDFTYIDNVVQANLLAIEADSKKIFDKNKDSSHEIFNIAFGENITLNELVVILKNNLANIDRSILEIESIYGPEKEGDIPHSLASIDKARNLLGYNPKFSLEKGLKIACRWYYNNYFSN